MYVTCRQIFHTWSIWVTSGNWPAVFITWSWFFNLPSRSTCEKAIFGGIEFGWIVEGVQEGDVWKLTGDIKNRKNIKCLKERSKSILSNCESCCFWPHCWYMSSPNHPPFFFRPSPNKDTQCLCWTACRFYYRDQVLNFRMQILGIAKGYWVVATQIVVIFTPNPGEMIQLDEHIFQMGWFNHQLGYHVGPQKRCAPLCRDINS